MPKRISVIVSMAAIIVGGLILLFAQPSATSHPGAVVSPPTPSTTPSIQTSATSSTAPLAPNANLTSTVDTSNWKTYRNDEYGFQLKYPADLAIATTSYDDLYNLGHAFQVQLGYPGLDDQVVVTDYLDAGVRDVIKTVHLGIAGQRERTINNIDWNLYGFREAAGGLDFEFSEAFAQHGSSTFRIGAKGQAYPFDQMLSTFEFLRQ
jgi:hypothetical protein